MISNCHIIYTKLFKNQINVKEFQYQIALHLLEFEKLPLAIRPSDDLLNGHEPIQLFGNYPLRCKVCYKDSENKKIMKRSSFKCKKCSEVFGKEIILCIENYFGKYHKMRNNYM